MQEPSNRSANAAAGEAEQVMGQRGPARQLTEPGGGDRGTTVKPPLHPYLVLLIAIFLPGVGQVVNNTPQRGFMFLFFILSLGWVTSHLASPEASFVGRYAGGFLIYAISVMDAYRWARYRWSRLPREKTPAAGRSA